MHIIQIEGAVGLFVEIPGVDCTMDSIFSKEDKDYAQKIEGAIECLS